VPYALKQEMHLKRWLINPKRMRPLDVKEKSLN
jgi:hypothetical protein